MEKAAKKILIGIGIFFLTVLCLILLDRLLLRRIYCYSTRSEGLQYAYDLVKSDELLGMDYSECCDYLKSVEDEYPGDFRFWYENHEKGHIDKREYSFHRAYVAGTACNEYLRMNSYILKICFNDDGEVIYAFIEERKANG